MSDDAIKERTFEIAEATAATTAARPFDDDQLAAFLARMRNAVLATIRADGSPQATPVWFHWDGAVMRISTPDWTRKTHNVRRDARVSVCVDDQVSGAYVTLFGRAELVEGDRELVRRQSWPILLKYFHEDEARARWARIDAKGDRVVMLIVPDRVIWRDGVR